MLWKYTLLYTPQNSFRRKMIQFFPKRPNPDPKKWFYIFFLLFFGFFCIFFV